MTTDINKFNPRLKYPIPASSPIRQRVTSSPSRLNFKRVTFATPENEPVPPIPIEYLKRNSTPEVENLGKTERYPQPQKKRRLEPEGSLLTRLEECIVRLRAAKSLYKTNKPSNIPNPALQSEEIEIKPEPIVALERLKVEEAEFDFLARKERHNLEMKRERSIILGDLMEKYSISLAGAKELFEA